MAQRKAEKAKKVNTKPLEERRRAKKKTGLITRKRYKTYKKNLASENALAEPIASKALETFQNEEKARRWLEKPNRSLDNKRPIDVLRTREGAKRVEELLDRIKYGIYS